MREIARILSSLKSDEIEIFLEQLLTDTEQDMIRRRWELVRLLHQGVPQRDIASRLSMSLCKVTRGAKELKRPDSVFRKILEEKQVVPETGDTQNSGGVPP
ncbi:MAG TPA: Trp family transcriptional regulator [Spirochaetota bacterium]|nr:Trp family transcriptional regulator [Spirochaetota bacterium]HPH02651.1 Trp family transcriptional regulator [Spirochaetota bacterium]HPN81833.1 Trp family transcriptional regulator [Spirochaetota bacterium]